MENSTVEEEKADYLIWSAMHQGWWGPARCGYSKGLLGAGKYTRSQAIQLCRDSIPNAGHVGHCATMPVRFEDVREFTIGALMPSQFMKGER